MRRRVMSFEAYAASFDGAEDEAYDAWADHMADLRAGRHDLEVNLAPPRVDWDTLRVELEQTERAAIAYIRVLDPHSFWACGFRVAT